MSDDNQSLGSPLKNIDFEFHDGKIIINESQYPNAAKVINIENYRSPLVKEIKDYALHRDDLKLALQFLETINVTNNNLAREAIWYSAITLFIKCFEKSNSRVKLDNNKVYTGLNIALQAFRYFKSLRDKHVVHDENPYSQTNIGAIINKSGIEPKVADIVSFVIRSNTLNQEHWSSLQKLTSHALEWVEKEQHSLHTKLAQQYEKKEYNELNKLNVPPSFRVPSGKDVHRRRKQ